jgi:predicted aspartyl protease
MRRPAGVVVGMLVLAGAPPPVARVPFVWTPGQIEVAVRVDGTPATFLLDTGAEYSVVSSRLARARSLATERQRARDFASDVEIGVGSIVLKHQRVMVMPFDTYYARGRSVDGLVGYDFFARHVVEIDFAGRRLTIWEPSKYKPRRGDAVVPIEFAGRLPVLRSTLDIRGGRSVDARLMIDTGASQAVILRYPFARDHDLLDLAPGAPATTAPSLASGEFRMVDVPIDRLELSRWAFDDARVRAFAEPVGSGASTDTDGLIGNAILARFTMTVDYPRRRVLLRQ